MADRNNSGLGTPAVVITLLAALGIGGTIRRSPAPPNPTAPAGIGSVGSSYAKSGTAKFEKNGGYDHSAAYLLEKFFARLDDEEENKKPWATYGDSASKPEPFAGSGFSTADPRDSRIDYSVSFLIATLPLPTSPPLRYFFDSELDALESAAGTAGYSLDSYDFPWNESKDTGGKFQLGGELDITSTPPKSADAKPSDDAKKGFPYAFAVKPSSEGNNRWRHDPGVILFRQAGKLLVIFVIGETPTWGINRLAMRDALDQIAWLKGWDSAPDEDHKRPPLHLVNLSNDPFSYEIRIIGPTFSSSAPSMRNTLEDWGQSLATRLRRGTRPSIRIISGTATSVDACALSAAGNSAKNLPSISFRTVQIPDPVLWKQLPQILKDIADVQRKAPIERANAGEASATRKASAGCLSPTPTPMAAATAKPAPSMAILGENTAFGKGSNVGSEGDVLHLTFPLHISDLRSAQKGSQGKTVSGPDLGRHDLDLPDEASQQRMDVIPTYSPRGAIYDQLAMSNLLTEIRRENIRYVGIVAADVEDLIFLVQQIRAYCPDTIVFTTSADIRFLHSEVNTDLRGLLVFTTYPLFDLGQKWTSPFEGESALMTFSSDTAHGVYNATLAQLNLPDKMLDYGEPFAAEPHYPVIQLGVVGRDDIWPLAFQIPNLTESSGPSPVLENHSGPSRPQSKTIDIDGSIYPPAFEFLFVLLNIAFFVCALLLLVVEVYLRWNWSGSVAQTTPSFRFRVKRWLKRLVDQRWWLSAMLPNSPGGGFAKQRWLYVMFFSIGMLLAEIVGLGFALLPALVVTRTVRPALPVLPFLAQFVRSVFFAFGWPRGLAFGFEIITALLVLVVALLSTIRMFRSFVFRPIALAWLVAATFSILLALLFIGHQWTQTPLSFALYAFLRATHLHSGVSPLTALIFLAVAGFALLAGAFFRVAMLEDRPLPSLIPPVDIETASFNGVVELWNRVVSLLENSLIAVPVAWLLGPLFLTGFTYFWLNKVNPAFSIDGKRFDLLFILLGFGVYSMFSFALLRFMYTWIALRQLLHRLYFHPSRYFYKNLQLAAQPTPLDRQKIRLYEARPGLTAIEYGLSCVRAMIRMATALHAKDPADRLAADIVHCNILKEILAEAEVLAGAVLDNISWAASVSVRKALNETMAKLSIVVVSVFEPVWRVSARTSLLQVDLNSADDKATPDRMLVDQAELFVASRVADFVRNVFPHLINLVGCAMPAVLAMVLAVSAYPFPAHDTLLWVSWSVLLATVAISLYVFISINRNPIISMFSGTDPGQFNWDNTFTLHLVVFAVIPILTLLGAQFPQALSGTVSWVGSIFGGSAGG